MNLRYQRPLAIECIERAVRGHRDKPGASGCAVPHQQGDSLNRLTFGADHRAADPGRQPDLDASDVALDLDRGGLLAVRSEAVLTVPAGGMPPVPSPDAKPDPVRAAPVLDVERAVRGGHSEPVIAVRLTE